MLHGLLSPRHLLVSLALAAFIPAISKAGPNDNAGKTVQSASDDQLRAELQRRFLLRNRPAGPAGAQSAGPAVRSRGLNPLSSAPETTLIFQSRSRGLYGKDTRTEWYGIEDRSIRRLAQATVALFKPEILLPGNPSDPQLWKTLQDVQKVCADEKFALQPAPPAAFCSGTLVGPDIVLTAGHCVRNISPNPETIPPVTSTKFVFGYRIEARGASAPAPIPAENVFLGKEYIDGEWTQHQADWALVRLDRKVPSSLAEPVSDWGTAPLDLHQRVFMIGYPDGLPLKYAPGAEVRDNSPRAHFVANLNSFHGNSGSAVFDEATKRLIGVLVRGEPDYHVPTGEQCMRADVCPKFCDPSGCTRHCKGEDVTRIAAVRMH